MSWETGSHARGRGARGSRGPGHRQSLAGEGWKTTGVGQTRIPWAPLNYLRILKWDALFRNHIFLF